MQRQALAWRQSCTPVGFVPTMGFLHEGHLSLVRQARRKVGPDGQVVLSIFVNPTQFAPTEDLDAYPRDEARDLQLCRAEGVDVVFIPEAKDMYPEGCSTSVVEESLSSQMEAETRPTHFKGVTTVVTKLFNLVQPTVSVFGQKDFQQAAIIRRMTRDLNLPIKIVVAPTVREADGLAMSSRNKYLNPAQREQAVALWKSMQQARKHVREAKEKPPTAASLRLRMTQFINGHPEAKVDYIAFFDPESLTPVSKVHPGTHVALAVYFGTTRLIDNLGL